jgi:hypothetical protein
MTGDVDTGECDECAALPGDFPCAECYISGEKLLPADAVEAEADG